MPESCPEFVRITEAGDWVVEYHRWFKLNPEDAGGYDCGVEGFNAWDLMFTETLFQAKNHVAGLVLDVGWYPHADPSGCYVVCIVRVDSSSGQTDWQSPVMTYETRVLNEAVNMVQNSLQRRNWSF